MSNEELEELLAKDVVVDADFVDVEDVENLEVDDVEAENLDVEDFDVDEVGTIKVVETCDVTQTQISAGTVSRSIILFVALLNQILSIKGMSVLPIEDEVVEETVSMMFTIGAAVSAWWYNNSFSSAALIADDVLAKILSEDEVG